MNCSKLKLASFALVSCFISFGAIADTEQKGINPIYEVVRVSAHALNMNKAELNSAIHVISKFQAGLLTLPELEALSDSQILSEIDFYAEPYSEMTDEFRLITWKKYELETEMLAKEANVDLAKFAPFYRSINITVGIGTKIYLAQLSQAPRVNTNSSEPVVECNASCQALQDEDTESIMAQLDFLADMLAWENAYGPQAYGTTVRIVDNASGHSVEVKKYIGSFTWLPSGNVNNCGAAACI